MAHITLGMTAANEAYDLLSQCIEPDWSKLESSRGSGSVWDPSELIVALDELRSRTLFPLLQGRAAGFEGQVGVLLHERIQDSHALQDPDFWRWLALQPMRETILDRHQARSDEMPHRINFGLGSWTEGFPYRAWLRADIGHDPAAMPSERYSLALRGDQDFWRSFVIRPKYGYHRNIIHALIEFQYPDPMHPGVLVKGVESDGIRLLAKRLAYSQANTAYALLSRDGARRLIERLAVGLTRSSS